MSLLDTARASLAQSYVTHMTTYFSRLHPDQRKEDIEAKVRKICNEKYKPQTIVHVKMVRYGENEIIAEDLGIYFERYRTKIITPNGCVYKTTDEQVGIVPQLVKDQLKQRSIHKKAQLKAKSVGDTALELQHYYAQTTIKINVNSLPGGMGSSFNVFYDKGNYNSITSMGRSMIAMAYTTGEHVLGGNFAWFSEEELLNHLVIHLSAGIPIDKIRDVMLTHGLFQPTANDLLKFYYTTIVEYKPNITLYKVGELVRTFCPEELAFFWYFQNLRHIMWGNEGKFKPWISELFDLTKIPLRTDVNPFDLYKIDGELVSVIAVAFNELFTAIDDDGKKLQAYDFPNKRPDLAMKFISIANHINYMFDSIQNIIDVFINTDLNIPAINNKKFTNRNTVVLSDTDSVIFTTKDWVEWYTGDYLTLSTQAYQIAGCAVYWLTKAVAHCMKKFSIAHGATGEYVHFIEMKNEFLFPTMIIFGIKKTYAGQYKVQEGVVLDKLTTDIKGVQLRGSDICHTSNEFIEDFLVKEILEKSTQRLSAVDLIGKVVAFEQRIKESVLNGETEFYKMLSIRMEKDYDIPISSNYFYLMAWQEIYAKKYGDIQPPTKTAIAFLNPPTAQYYEILESMDKRIAKRSREFFEKYRKHPSSICINPMIERVPKELIPLIDVRKVIYHNTKALYTTLQQIGISSMPDKKDKLRLLFSDIYGPEGTINS